jgi:hypothetical protein
MLKYGKLTQILKAILQLETVCKKYKHKLHNLQEEEKKLGPNYSMYELYLMRNEKEMQYHLELLEYHNATQNLIATHRQYENIFWNWMVT